MRATFLRNLAGKVRSQLRAPQRRRIDPDFEALVSGESLVMHAGPRPMADAATLFVLREGIMASRVCQFDYAASNGRSYRRQVNPYGILWGRTYYLVGPEQEKVEPMLWRLDRMKALQLGLIFDGPPTGFDLRHYAARSFGAFQEAPERIVLRFAPSAATDARRFDFHPGQVLKEEHDGSLKVEFEAGGLLELAHHLFTWGESVEVIAPERLRTLLIERLRSALAKHVC